MQTFTPAEAQQMLGVSDASLRRLARAYERVYGELPTVNQTRIYPDEALKRIQAAREVLQQGKAASFERALEMLSRSTADPEDLLAQPNMPEPVELVLNELRAIHARLDGIEEENRALREQLKALTPPTDTPSGGKAEYVAEMEKIHADYERRLKYLQGELERRDGQAQPIKRPWWQVWKR
jgi:hypothetical protein